MTVRTESDDSEIKVVMAQNNSKKHIIVIGGGAAGMFSAVTAARAGARVTLLEKNEKLGKKIYITGKGRCNLTNNSNPEELMQAVCGRSKFLYSAFSNWNAQDTMRFFEEAGLRLKEERGRRVFPVSDHASDVTKTLEAQLKQQGVIIRLNMNVSRVLTKPDGSFFGVDTHNCQTGAKEIIMADACVIATGGLSYPSTGSTGDGYRFASVLGHKITPLSPSLIPFESDTEWVCELTGLTLKNVGFKLILDKKALYEERIAEVLFTHFGISGPAVLTASSMLTGRLYPQGYPDILQKTDHMVTVALDLKPALTEEELDRRLVRELNEHHRQNFRNAVQELFPKKLLPVFVRLSGIDAEKKADQITSAERRSFGRLMKNLTVHITALRGWDEAVITHGGISTREVNPKTMESKIIRGVFFAGEVLDVDAVTGGFNLQIAWSTGYAAGIGAAHIEGEKDELRDSN